MWPSGCPPGWPPSTCQAKPKHTDQSRGTALPPGTRVGDATEDAHVHPASLSSGGQQLQLLSGAHPAETCETFATSFYSNGSTSLTTYLKRHMQRSLGKTFPLPHAAHSPSSHLTPNGRSLEIPDKPSEVIFAWLAKHREITREQEGPCPEIQLEVHHCFTSNVCSWALSTKKFVCNRCRCYFLL